MKATDLMIGDWVLVQDAPNAGFRPCRVTIGLLRNLLISNETKRSVMPIPLTPEILEKNATSIERGYYIFGKYPNTLYVMFDSQAGVRIIEGDCEYYGIELKYVHELQHALKLYRIEKEVVV